MSIHTFSPRARILEELSHSTGIPDIYFSVLSTITHMLRPSLSQTRHQPYFDDTHQDYFAYDLPIDILEDSPEHVKALL